MSEPSSAASPATELAILGGGCFWCLEAVYQDIRGVTSVISGYMGGHVVAPDYEEVCGKKTGHAEVVRIAFDPSVISYRQLLAIFFRIHDPTTPNRQGNDVGPQYRSMIFAMSEAQLDDARAAMHALQGHASPVVTELVDARHAEVSRTRFAHKSNASPGLSVPAELVFWPAEDGHQNYFRTNPYQGYCAFVVAPKVEKAQHEFRELIARSSS